MAILLDMTSLHVPVLAGELIDLLDPRPGDVAVAADLAATLHDLSVLLDRHIADEERDIFPLIAEHVRVADYAWLQQQFRRNLSPRTLPFVVPWVVRHSTSQELPALVTEAAAGPAEDLPGPVHRAGATGLRGGLGRPSC